MHFPPILNCRVTREGILWAFQVAEVTVVQPAPPRLFPLVQPQGAASEDFYGRRKLQQIKTPFGLKIRTLFMIGAFPDDCTLAPGQHRRNLMNATVSFWRGGAVQRYPRSSRTLASLLPTLSYLYLLIESAAGAAAAAAAAVTAAAAATAATAAADSDADVDADAAADHCTKPAACERLVQHLLAWRNLSGHRGVGFCERQPDLRPSCHARVSALAMATAFAAKDNGTQQNHLFAARIHSLICLDLPTLICLQVVGWRILWLGSLHAGASEAAQL